MRNTGQSYYVYRRDIIIATGKNTLQRSKCGGCVLVGNVHVPVPGQDLTADSDSKQ